MTGSRPANGAIRALLIVLGTLSVALGVVGMLLPLLPTTPFLLLAAACYSRSSERFYHRLVTNRWFGEYIRNYRDGIGIPVKQKVITIVALWLVIGSAAWLATSQAWERSILLGIAVVVTVYLVRTKTYQPEAETGRLQSGEVGERSRRGPVSHRNRPAGD